MSWEIVFTRQAEKDLSRITQSPLKAKAFRLLSVLEEDPFCPPWEKLTDLDHVYSRRINLQHRLVYKVMEQEKTIVIIRMWTHYTEN